MNAMGSADRMDDAAYNLREAQRSPVESIGDGRKTVIPGNHKTMTSSSALGSFQRLIKISLDVLYAFQTNRNPHKLRL